MNIPKEWTLKPLTDVVEIQRGFDLPHHARKPGPYPVLTAGETGGFHDEGPIKGPGVTIGRATNLGRPKWSDVDFWPHNTTMFVKDFKGNCPRWIYHLFEATDLSGFDSGSVQPMLNRNYIAQVPVRVPPLREQQAISEVLGAFDEKITINAKIADNADSFIRLRYDAAIQSATPIAKPFLETFNVEFGEAFKGDKFVEPGFGRPLIRIRDLKTFSSQVWTTESRPREIIVNAGDVVVGMDAEFRATSWLGEPGLLNQRVCRVTSKFGKSAFVREALRQPLATIESYKTATTVIHLNKKDLEENTVLIPDKEAIKYFETTTEILYGSRVALAAENRALAATRDVLLPQLMSGRLRVKDAEALVESVV